LHGIKNPVVVELPSDEGMRRFEITQGEQVPESAPPSSDVDQPKITQGPLTPQGQ